MFAKNRNICKNIQKSLINKGNSSCKQNATGVFNNLMKSKMFIKLDIFLDFSRNRNYK